MILYRWFSTKQTNIYEWNATLFGKISCESVYIWDMFRKYPWRRWNYPVQPEGSLPSVLGVAVILETTSLKCILYIHIYIHFKLVVSRMIWIRGFNTMELLGFLTHSCSLLNVFQKDGNGCNVQLFLGCMFPTQALGGDCWGEEFCSQPVPGLM